MLEEQCSAKVYLLIGSLLYGNPCLGCEFTRARRLDWCFTFWTLIKCPSIVIIKGTQVYDTTRGKFIDLSVLDVLQIFGRAGRPGMEASGEGYICTTEDKLAYYLDAVTSSVHRFSLSKTDRLTISSRYQLNHSMPLLSC